MFKLVADIKADFATHRSAADKEYDEGTLRCRSLMFLDMFCFLYRRCSTAMLRTECTHLPRFRVVMCRGAFGTHESRDVETLSTVCLLREFTALCVHDP